MWKSLSNLTWSDLSDNIWWDFYTTLAETETHAEAQGVKRVYSGTVSETGTESYVQGVRAEYSSTVAETGTEMVVNVIITDNDYRGRMFSYLPKYERKSGVFDEILTGYDGELRNLEQSNETVNRNLFIDTAVEALRIYERDLGIVPETTLNYVQRREQVSSRYRAAFSQATEQAVKDVANSFENGTVEINPTDTVGVYEITFVDEIGIPNNIEGLKQAIDIVVPAHIDVTYKFTYNAWSFFTDYTWGDLSGMTWQEMKSEVIV